ncbi:MAG: DUF2911 domain-containing protein [Terriglobales bacterium]
MYARACGCVLFVVSLYIFSNAQNPQLISSVCTFDDGRQISVKYAPEPGSNQKLEEGKVWSPGNSPMFFFTSAPLAAGKSQVPIGAFSMYLLRERKNWNLVLNKDVAGGSKYDERQDLLRATMQTGQISEPQQFKVLFAHVAPKQCNMRIYQGKTGAWIEFQEK